MIRQPDQDTLNQLKRHGYTVGSDVSHHDPARPLLVCDVDEVILHLVSPFVTVLQERGFELKSHSFKLTGNVFHRDTGREATQEEVWAGLTQLFEEQKFRQHVVNGAANGLAQLASDIDILFLTNMPHAFGDIRRDYLASAGMSFPLITNTGSKAPAIEHIKQVRNGKIGFIDDTPRNLEQVAEAHDDVALFHFMADDTFRGLANEVEGVHFSTGDWTVASSGIRNVLL
ncbi:MAG: hypothetical protein AAGF28_07385 [Pseudomonadota bacterium]